MQQLLLHYPCFLLPSVRPLESTVRRLIPPSVEKLFPPMPPDHKFMAAILPIRQIHTMHIITVFLDPTTSTTMKPIYHFVAAILTGAAFLYNHQLHAQLTPHHSQDGLTLANTTARSILPDGILVMVGAGGDTVISGATMTIDLTEGSASAWGYFYYSPGTKRWTTIGLFDVLGSGLQASVMNSPVPIPTEMTRMIDTTLPFATSTSFVAQLSKNATFAHYRLTHPAASPNLIAYRSPIQSELALLPESFPVDAPLWGVQFRGTGDAAMRCWVSGRTGESYCLQESSAASVEGAREQHRAEFITAVPNPGGDLVRVIVVPPAGATPRSTFALYNVAGKSVLEPLRVVREGERSVATFDMASLPSGIYYCHVTGDSWNDSIAIEH
jgi:hypothetical protein